MATSTVLVIGSGFGGQLAAMTLLRRGLDVTILERRDFMGGTWCQNSYPGAAVDVPSPLYSIASEPWPWTQMYADQAELRAYTEHVIDAHRLRERTVLGADVTAAEWDGTQWCVRTSDGAEHRARFLVNATGPLSTPVVPDFPGLADFEGASFHTNGWDHDVDLAGARVAVVGSGASAAQVIPAIQPEAGRLHVFQRSPHWVMPRRDHVFTPWQRRLLRARPLQRALRTWIYWRLETRVIGFKHSRFLLRRAAQRAALQHIEAQVPDPELRAKVTPDYTLGCKRVILSDTLYPALSAANTTLHDRHDAIDHFDATGVVTASGEHLDLDVVVFSTGYDATDGLVAHDVRGRDGVRLADVWHDFPRAYLGTAVPGFPNFFVVTGPNTGIGHTSAIFVIESQMAYLERAIGAVVDSPEASIEVTAGAEDDYTAMIHREMEHTVWHDGGCTSWYQSRSGRVVAMFPGFSFSFRRLARRFRPEHHVISTVTSTADERIPA
ncbi:NAD(P)/FAD-dependent oxidoreductase [Nocardioides sp. J2M5]|uniref:flavin-containing monooxygenase n=1 Tax=Nocardioides palaemonis TaxID=2829810 RepID=UPI001BABEE2B|nr:NAD(P)/FAD-dependent oxidoreductase [Nocardioides palaemonis]MBS2936680.1 NAD(P)/FAD-dependent oxidoreductase [Nocardioides palaemonis]